MKNIEVGQKLFSLNVGNMARNREQKLTPVVVKKIGRKYFTAGIPDTTYADRKYYIDGWREVTEYCIDSELYESEDQYRKNVWKEKAERRLRRCFEYGTSKFSLEQIQAVCDILEVEVV